MKKLLTASLFSTLLLLIAICTNAQNVGIGTTNPLSTLAVGSNSQFRVDINGNIIRIRDVVYSFPTTQGAANTVLVNNGSGTLSWSTGVSVPRPVVRIFSVSPNGFSDWIIDNPGDYGSGSNLDPTLVLYRGFTYQFNINAAGHSFVISTSIGGAAYNVGVTNNGTGSGTITFTVPMDAPANLFYYCAIPGHLVMSGNITVQ